MMVASFYLIAQVPQPHGRVDPINKALNNSAEFTDPDTGAAGRWIGKNEFGPAHPMGVPYFLRRPLFVEPRADFSVTFPVRARAGRRARYRILASDNVMLTQRSEDKKPVSPLSEGADVTVSARLLDGRAGVILAYCWSYSGEEIVGYQLVGYKIYPAGTEGTVTSGYGETLMALRRLQKWDQGFSNW